jgi:hypothetical protein
MGKNFIRNKKNKLRKARKLLDQHVIESTTGWPRPSTAEAIIRQVQAAMMKAEVMRIASEIESHKPTPYYEDEDANDPHRYVRNFDRNSRW